MRFLKQDCFRVEENPPMADLEAKVFQKDNTKLFSVREWPRNPVKMRS
jgi:hypothetical protein